jgi:hypothetical protein
MSEKLNNNTVIKNISFNQKEILYNIMQLHNGGKPYEADMTASSLGFYKNKPNDSYIIPEPKILLDVFPQREDIIKIEPYKPLPLEDNSIDSMVCDLPFIVAPHKSPSVVNPKDGSNVIFNRFHSFYPASDMLAQYKFWIEEIYRVLKLKGQLILEDSDARKLKVKLKAFKNKVCGDRVKYHRPQELINMFTKFNFSGSLAEIESQKYIYIGNKK